MMRKLIQPPCKGRERRGYVDRIDKVEMIGRCTFPKCGAEVKVYQNEDGDYVSRSHRYQASPQWTDFIHGR